LPPPPCGRPCQQGLAYTNVQDLEVLSNKVGSSGGQESKKDLFGLPVVLFLKVSGTQNDA